MWKANPETSSAQLHAYDCKPTVDKFCFGGEPWEATKLSGVLPRHTLEDRLRMHNTNKSARPHLILLM